MSRKELFIEKIKITKYSIKVINYWTLFLLLLSIIVFLISFHIIPIKSLPNETINEILKFGFSILSILTPIGLQGFNHVKKNELVNLEFAKDNIENYESLSEIDQEIITYILKKITN